MSGNRRLCVKNGGCTREEEVVRREMELCLGRGTLRVERGGHVWEEGIVFGKREFKFKKRIV